MYWGIFRRSIHNPPLPPAPGSFLFVCQGNICRSPFAERMADLVFRGREDIRFGSSGTHVKRRMPSPKEAVNAARQFGVNLENHLSREIDLEILKSYDMILVMETMHYWYLNKNFGRFRDRIFLLPLFESGQNSGADLDHIYNIEDPYGKQLDSFLNCYNRIKACLEGLFEQLQKN